MTIGTVVEKVLRQFHHTLVTLSVNNPEKYVFNRWARPDVSWRSGAAILEIDIPTGFYVRKQTLRKTVAVLPRVPPNRFRFTRQKVILYLDYVRMTLNECVVLTIFHGKIENGEV